MRKFKNPQGQIFALNGDEPVDFLERGIKSPNFSPNSVPMVAIYKTASVGFSLGSPTPRPGFWEEVIALGYVEVLPMNNTEFILKGAELYRQYIKDKLALDQEYAESIAIYKVWQRVVSIWHQPVFILSIKGVWRKQKFVVVYKVRVDANGAEAFLNEDEIIKSNQK